MLSHGLVLSRLVHDQDAARKLIANAAALADKSDDVHLKTRALVAQGLLADQEGRSDDALGYVRAGRQPRPQRRRSGRAGDGAARTGQIDGGGGEAAPALKLADELLAIAKSRGIPAQLAHARLTNTRPPPTPAIRSAPKRRCRPRSTSSKSWMPANAWRCRWRTWRNSTSSRRRFGEAARTSEAALRIAREVGDDTGSRLASFQLGIATIYFRNIAGGRAMVEKALAGMQGDERYVRMLLDYGHALNQVGWGDDALTIYEKAGSVSLAAWRKEKQLSYQALQRAYAVQKKQAELTALHHESQLKAAELANVKRLRSMWVLLSATTLAAVRPDRPAVRPRQEGERRAEGQERAAVPAEHPRFAHRPVQPPLFLRAGGAATARQARAAAGQGRRRLPAARRRPLQVDQRPLRPRRRRRGPEKTWPRAWRARCANRMC